MGSLWNRSGLVERYADDLRATGAKAYFFLGGTTTPMSVYQDSAESSAHSNPVLADSNGRWPDVFVPYITSYDVLVQTTDGVQLTYTLEIPNPDPVSLSVTIPPENQVQTGMIHAELVQGTKAGFVRLNGRTIGNAVSGATERANADTSALFTYLWNNLTNDVAPVSAGRGASAAADFAANKTIQLLDFRGSTVIGLDDMGNVASSSFAGLIFLPGSASATTPGAITGANKFVLGAGLLAHSHESSNLATRSDLQTGGAATAVTGYSAGTTASFMTGTTGSASSINNSPFAYLVTWFIKL